MSIRSSILVSVLALLFGLDFEFAAADAWVSAPLDESTSFEVDCEVETDDAGPSAVGLDPAPHLIDEFRRAAEAAISCACTSLRRRALLSVTPNRAPPARTLKLTE